MKKDENVYEVIRNDKRFGVLSRILESTGIGEAMSRERETFTFFAPTDHAFSDLSDEALKFLMSRDGREVAAAILSYHLVPKSYLYSKDLRERDSVENLNGTRLRIREEENVLHLGKAHILTPAIAAANGVVFPVDKVLPLVIKPRAEVLKSGAV